MLAIEFQNNMLIFHLLYLRFNKIVTIPVLMSDNRNFYARNPNKCAVTKWNINYLSFSFPNKNT